MHGTAPGVRADPATKLAAIGRQRPEWRTWLDMLGEVLPWLNDPALSSPLGGGEPELVSSTDPLLQGRELLIDAERLTDLVHRLLKIAAMEARSGLGGYLPSTETVLDLLAAAMRHDHVAIEDMAAAAGIQPAALDTVAQVAAYPVLQSHGKLLQAHVQLSWAHGYCPICGSWPLLGEFRGLDRTRRLRCARCAGDWRVDWLRCPYCGESDHERLGSLVLEEKLQTLTVETCLHCFGYLKSVTTLQAIPPVELLLRDVETVELDIAARDRGYVRPEGAGFPLDLRVTADRPSGDVAVGAQWVK